MFNPQDRIYIALDRTSWGAINILMVSVIYVACKWTGLWTNEVEKGSQ